MSQPAWLEAGPSPPLSFLQLANQELAAWQSAWAASLAYNKARAEALKNAAADIGEMRQAREAQAAVLMRRPAGVSIASPERWHKAIEAAHLRATALREDEFGVPGLRDALTSALAAYDEALLRLARARATTFEQLAHQLSRLAASEQEARATDLEPDGALPATPNGYRAALREPGGFEPVMRHLRSQLIDLAGLQSPGAA